MRRNQFVMLGFTAVLLGITAVFLSLGEPVFWAAEIAALLSIAVAAFTGGWIAGAGTVFVLVLLFLPDPHHLSEEWFEWIAIAAIMTLARFGFRRLEKSELRIRALLSALDDLIVVLDANGTILEIASTRRRPLYKPSEHKVGRRVHDVYPQDYAEWCVETIQKALQEQRIVEADYSLPIDGQTIWWTVSVSPLTESTVIWVERDITARKAAEEAVQRANVELERSVAERTRELSDSEQRYRSVFDQAQEIIVTLSGDAMITSLNPAFERVLGWSRDAWIGQPIASLVPDDYRERAQRLLDGLRRGEEPRLSRLVLLGDHGRRVTLEITVVHQIIGGHIVGFLAIARDITDREEAEERVRRSERQLAEAQRSAGLGSYEHDLLAGTMLWSDELFRILEVPPTHAPLPFSTLENLVAEEDRPKIEEAHRTLLARGEHEWEIRVLLPSGTEKILCCTGSVVSNPAQGVLRVVGAVKDITERKRGERMLQESEQRFRLIANATNDVIWDWDIVTGTIHRGKAFEELYGYPPDDTGVSSDSLVDRVHPDDREKVRDRVLEALGSGEKVYSIEYRFRRIDGSYAQILDRGSIVRDPQKKPVRMVGAMMDLTERNQLEEQLEQAKRVNSLGRVAASIAHEFNNVLMGIQPNIEVIRRSSPKGLGNVTDNILHAVRRGKRITDEILRYTRPAEPNLECLPVSEFFERWQREMVPLLGENIDLEIDTESDVYVLGDPLQLAQVFTNLALNARDAMQDRRGKLLVSANLSKSFGSFPFGVVKSPDRFIHFQVHDEGCGIARDRLGNIFEPLFTSKAGGIGLGLAIAYQIITRHEGHIFVESELGSGTTFHLFIPATSPMIQQAPAPQPQAHTPLHRVVLVEDEPSVSSGMAMLLEMEGIDVAVASTGAESIPAIESFSPDVVVLDIGLPDMDGVGVYQEIARRWPGLPVLFSSGHGDSAKLETYLARPNVGFILKPYEFDAMRRELNRLVASRVTEPAR